MLLGGVWQMCAEDGCYETGNEIVRRGTPRDAVGTVELLPIQIMLSAYHPYQLQPPRASVLIHREEWSIMHIPWPNLIHSRRRPEAKLKPIKYIIPIISGRQSCSPLLTYTRPIAPRCHAKSEKQKMVSIDTEG